MAGKKTWSQKFETSKNPKVEVLEHDFSDIPAGSKMLIATPRIFDNYIRAIPSGNQTSFKQMRKDIAISHQADNTCPLTTGIFVRIVAEKAWEEHINGKSVEDITPFWRVIEPKSPLRKKLSCGTQWIDEQRMKELS